MRKRHDVLLVEDDAVDAQTVVRAFKKLGIQNKIIRAENGEDALDLLTESDRQKPGLILLDLNMPKMSGLEFLKILKGNPDLKIIPVVVLTTSRDDGDKLQSFQNGVSGYMVKPVDFAQFTETIRTVDVYWTTSENPLD